MLFRRCLFLLILLAGCSKLEPPGGPQPLVVGLPFDPIFLQNAGPSEEAEGYSRDLAALFAESMNVKLHFIAASDYPSLMALMREGKLHMAATMPARAGNPHLRYTQPLLETRQLIVRHASDVSIDTPQKLSGRELATLPDSPQQRAFQPLEIVPPPLFVEHAGIDELELLAGVASRRFDLAASDDLHFAVAANFNPDLDIAVELPGKLAYVWAFPATETALLEKASRFLEAARADGTLRRLEDRYFGHIRRLNARDIATFLESLRTRLPDFREMFHEAQEISGIDWRLLAALAYQESKWDPLATSPTGVRGMMMLTEETADRLMVDNRLDARESIHAGANYLAQLMDELPQQIRQPDRLWFALAAYNLGMGHLNGGRQFAPGLKRNPDLWVDMKQVLPLLARPEYYSRLKSGRARGGEAVILVENIRNYFDILSRLEPGHTPKKWGAESPRKPVKKRKAAKKKPKPQRQTAITSSPPR